MNGESCIAAAVAFLLTIFDLDRIFYIPEKTERKVQLGCWQFAFVFANGAFAMGVSAWVQQAQVLNDWNWALRGLTIGGAYLAIVRAKLTTFEIGGKTVPFGVELFYEAAKDFAYKRINRIAKHARLSEATELANKKTLKELGQQAKLGINQYALLKDEDKRAAKEWLVQVINDGKSGDDFDQRAAIADFILSGRRGG